MSLHRFSDYVAIVLLHKLSFLSFIALAARHFIPMDLLKANQIIIGALASGLCNGAVSSNIKTLATVNLNRVSSCCSPRRAVDNLLQPVKTLSISVQ